MKNQKLTKFSSVLERLYKRGLVCLYIILSAGLLNSFQYSNMILKIQFTRETY